MGQEMWERIQDNLIRHVWKRAEDDDCDEDDGFVSPRWLETFISPGWYEKNGTPICDNCGQDMEYSHTMIWCTNKPEVRGNEMWETIQDDLVRHVWERAAGDDCKEDPRTVVLPPGWYEDNGTPICGCGEDMVYSHTEILKHNDAKRRLDNAKKKYKISTAKDLVKWLEEERNLLSNTASFMIDVEEYGNTLRVTKAIDMTLKYVKLCELRTLTTIAKDFKKPKPEEETKCR